MITAVIVPHLHTVHDSGAVKKYNRTQLTKTQNNMIKKNENMQNKIRNEFSGISPYLLGAANLLTVPAYFRSSFDDDPPCVPWVPPI